MPTSLLPSIANAAARILVNVQSATTRVKELITSNVVHGISEEETTKQLNKLIAEECSRVDNTDLREQTRKALVASARKWHWQMKETYRILDNNLRLKQPLGININDLLSMTPFQKEIEFRKVLDDGRSPGIPVIKDYRQSVKLALRALAADPPKVVTRRDGGTYIMPLRNRAELAVRYEANTSNLQSLVDGGADLAWTSSHPNCSPRCKDYQGRLWSLKGQTGAINGVRYEPIDIALSGKKNDGNGIISGYNCRHRLVAYKAGSKPPSDFSEAEMKKEYAIDKQQRDYENRIRHMKTEEKGLRASGFTKEASELRKRWRRLTIDYQTYSIKNNRAYYPERYIIDRSELPGYDGNLTNDVENGNINEQQTSTKLAHLNLVGGVFENKSVKNTFANLDVSTVDNRVVELYQSLSNMQDIKVIQSTARGNLRGDKVTLNNPNTIKGQFTNMHELGHLINQQFNPVGVRWNDSLSQRSEELSTAIRKEVVDHKEILNKLDSVSALDTKQKREDYKKDNPIQEIYDNALAELRKDFSGTQLDWARAAMSLKERIEKSYNNILIDLWENPNDQSNLTLYDMADAMTLGRALSFRVLPAGHGTEYFSRISMIKEELFANYMALKIQGSEKQLDAFAKLFPETSKALDSVVDDAINIKRSKYGR